jgi:hypothetical protein
MATDKQFSVIGVSTLNGDTKVRFANDTMRIKILSKNGHTAIQLIELSETMTKVDAVKTIKELPEFADINAQDAIMEYLAKNDKTATVVVKQAVKAAVVTKPAKAAVVTKPAKAAAPAKSKSEVQAMLDAAEDAPF